MSWHISLFELLFLQTFLYLPQKFLLRLAHFAVGISDGYGQHGPNRVNGPNYRKLNIDALKSNTFWKHGSISQ